MTDVDSSLLASPMVTGSCDGGVWVAFRAVVQPSVETYNPFTCLFGFFVSKMPGCFICYSTV